MNTFYDPSSSRSSQSEASKLTSPASLQLSAQESYDLFECSGLEQELVRTLEIPRKGAHTISGIIAVQIGGTIAQLPEEERRKSIEDRAGVAVGPEGTVMAIVIDGVGETYKNPRERPTFEIDGVNRVLGDVPGYILYSTLRAVTMDTPERLHTAQGIISVISEATARYREFLKEHALDQYLEGKKEKIGGCTFALAVVPPKGDMCFASVGDAIVTSLVETHAKGTRNQLPAVNAVLEPLKETLEEVLRAHGALDPKGDMREVFNKVTKPLQRNEFTNVETVSLNRDLVQRALEEGLSHLNYLGTSSRAQIVASVMKTIPEGFPGYGFFDGNDALAKHIQILTVPQASAQRNLILLSTDGAFNNRTSDHDYVHRSVLEDFTKGGVNALLNKNQSGSPLRGPEATVIALEF